MKLEAMIKQKKLFKKSMMNSLKVLILVCLQGNIQMIQVQHCQAVILAGQKPGVLVPLFEKQMNETAIGSISPIFETNYGWHFLEVIDRRTVNLSQEKLLESARMAIAESKYDSALNNWLQELRDNSFVHIKKSTN